jgi:hypothetical protein
MSKLISKLPEDIKAVALQRQRDSIKYWDKKTDILGDAFNWESTPEEHIIWTDVDNDNYEPFREFHAKQKQQENNGWISVEDVKKLLRKAFNDARLKNKAVDKVGYNGITGQKRKYTHQPEIWIEEHLQPLPEPPKN